MHAFEIETDIDENHEIHIKLPQQVLARSARVVVMYDDPTELPQAVKPGLRPRRFGQFQGQIEIASDFDAPLPDSFWSGEES